MLGLFLLTIAWTQPDSEDIFIVGNVGYPVQFGADYDYTTGEMFLIIGVDSGGVSTIPQDSAGYVVYHSSDHGYTWSYFDSYSYDRSYHYYSIGIIVGRNFSSDSLRYYLEVLGDTSINFLFYTKMDSSGAFSFFQEYCLDPSQVMYIKADFARDNFPSPYVYIASIKRVWNGIDTLYILRDTSVTDIRFDTLYVPKSPKIIDCDITVADSTVYFCYAESSDVGYVLNYAIIRNRGDGDFSIISFSGLPRIFGCRIGATTVLPDSTQTAYVLFSALDGTGNCGLYCCYEGAGSPPGIDTIVEGIPDTIMFSIRGYQPSPNQWMDIAYTLGETWIGGVAHQTYWRFTNVPGSWSEPDTVNPFALGGEYVPEIVYSPGASASGSGVIYYTPIGGGFFYFDAPWVTTGIEEDERDSEVVERLLYPGKGIEFKSRRVTIYDSAGRIVRKVFNGQWKGQGMNGQAVPGGVYYGKEESGNIVRITVIR